MRRNLLFIFVILALLIIPLSRACVTLDTYRTEFLPGETMQVEVDVNPGFTLARDIYSTDIYLYNSENQLISGNFFITKISKGKFFIWFDVPIVKGDYTLKVRSTCGTNELIPTDFKVLESKNAYYNFLKNQVNDRWPQLSLEENIMAGAALFYDEELNEDALASFFNRRDSCINTNCSTKNASLAIIAFRDFSTRSQMKDLIFAYQNSLKGDWRVEFNSEISEDCNLTVGNDTRDIDTFPGKNTFDIDFSKYLDESEVLIRDTCNLTSRKLIFSYKNFTKNFSMGNNFLVNNPGCFGNNFKNTCDPESTAYALFALKLAGFTTNSYNNAVQWLDENANSIDQVAILYYLTGDEGKLNQVLSSQNYNGAWQKNGVNDVRTTVMIYYILDSKNKTGNVLEALNKSNEYLEGKLPSASIAEKSYMLYFVFPNVEPFMSIWPGVVKVGSLESFNLILQNKGGEEIAGQIRFMNSTNNFEINKNSMKNIQINVPRIETPGGLIIGEVLQMNYINNIPNSITRTYDVPIIIFTFNGTGTYYGNFTINESEINESQRGGIINETINGSKYNQTTNLSGDLINQNFYFSQNRINRTFVSTDTISISVSLTNKLPGSIRNIAIRPSVRLLMLTIDPLSIDELKQNETKNILIYADPTNLGLQTGGKAEGTITAQGNYSGQDVTATVSVLFNSNVVQNLETCDELGGVDCTSEGKTCKNGIYNQSSDLGGRCCMTECVDVKPPVSTGSRTLAIIIVLAVIVILVVVLLIIKRKPKRDMKDFLDDISKDKQPGYSDGFDDVSQGQGSSNDFKKEFSDEDFEKFSQ